MLYPGDLGGHSKVKSGVGREIKIAMSITSLTSGSPPEVRTSRPRNGIGNAGRLNKFLALGAFFAEPAH
jgi:hypothetical protein